MQTQLLPDMNSITISFFLIGICYVAPQNQLPGQARMIPALKRLYRSIEHGTDAAYVLVKSLNTNTKCGPSTPHGGIHRIAIALELVSEQTKTLTTDLNEVIDNSGNFHGNLNQVDNDIIKLASAVNVLAKSVRNDAITRDYRSGDFKGAMIALENLAKSLDQLAAAFDRVRGQSKVVLEKYIQTTKVKKGIHDLTISIKAVIHSMNLELERCDQTAADVDYVTKGLADLNKGLKDVEDSI